MNELEKLQVDMQRIAQELKSLQGRLASIQIDQSAKICAEPTTLQKAKTYYRRRRTRETVFGKTDLFADPAWDMLIDLFIAQEEGSDVSVSSLCIAAAVPATTALRWITILESEGLIVRSRDSSDARRSYLAISADATDKVRSFFDV